MAMQGSFNFFDGVTKKNYTEIDVFQRTVRAGGRIIAVENISYVELIDGKSVVWKKISLFVISLMLFSCAIYYYPSFGSLICVAISIVFFVLFLRMSFRFFLSIATNDGSRTIFVGISREKFSDAIDFLHWKINSKDTAKTAHYNFTNNTITGSAIGDNARMGY